MRVIAARIIADRAFDLGIQALIVLSLVAFSIDTLPDLPPALRQGLQIAEVLTVAVFSVEYVVRLSAARPMRSYAFSFFGLVDLAAILPFYLALGLDFQSLRAVRLLRLFRAFKLVRYSAAIARLNRAFVIAREELILFACATMLILYFAAVGIYYFENEAQPDAFASVFDGLWWAVATLTTVGYGDVFPITMGGRFFTFIVLISGLGVVAVPTGLVASALSRAREDESRAASDGPGAVAQPPST